MTNFTHLHLHTGYSILDGYTNVEDVPKIVKGLGQSSVAVTDHGSLSSSLKFWKAAKEAEVKSIFGMEGYLTPDIKEKTPESPTWHIILLAMNRQGLNNLFQLSRIGWTEGFYKKARLDYKTLERYNEGILATSSCMAGEIARAIEKQDIDEGVRALKRYTQIFPQRFYVELQPGNTRELNESLSELAHSLSIPTVVNVDSHYDTCERKNAAEALLIMQQVKGFKQSIKDLAKLNYENAKRQSTIMQRLNTLWPDRTLRFDKHDLYIMSRDEVVERMDGQGFDGKALADVTLEISERCEQVNFELGKNYLPKIVKEDSNDYLRKLVYRGLKERGVFTDEYIDRVEEELAEIESKNFSDYFLIVWDIIREARSRNIYVGPGRGSAAGCLVAYALKITSIDPIKYGLLFFRFISPERNDFPDIDMDFEHRRRDEMKDYMRETYGDALGLSTFTTLKSKSLIRSLARVLSIPLKEVNDVCKQFNELDEYENAEGTKAFRASEPVVAILAKDLEGHISASGAHPAGLVVASHPMDEIVPIETRTDPEDNKKRIVISAFDMDDNAEVGLTKFDFLGLINLSIIHDTIDLIKERHDIDIDWEGLEPDDVNVFNMLNGANTVGVFQMESSPYRKLLLAMGVDNFNDMVASNALVRPGAFNTVAKDYIRRKKGVDKVTYPHPDVEKELEETYGVYIYQEQIMQLAVKLGKFTWGKADKLRKIIGKKLEKEEFAPYFDPWLENAGEKIGEKNATDMWHHFEAHSNYSFNKSHAVGYSYLGYVCAWLKYHYPLEYMYGLLKNEKKNTARMTYLLEARRLGIEILAPDVNYSQEEMSIDGNSLRFGLSDIKSVGNAACLAIIKARPFNNWEDFTSRVPIGKCNSRVRESIVSVDGFSSLEGAPRHPNPQENYMEYLNYPIALESIADLGINFSTLEEFNESEEEFGLICAVVKSIKRTDTYVRVELEDVTSSISVFGTMTNDLSEGEIVLSLVGDNSLIGYARIDGLEERRALQRLQGFEKWLFETGLDDYDLLRQFGIDCMQGEKSLVLPIQVKPIVTKKGQRMCYLYFADSCGHIEKAVVFAPAWKETEGKIKEFVPVCIKFGRLDDGSLVIWKNSVINPDDIMTQLERKIS